MALDLPIPYVAAQLLWINLVTNGLQDVALAFEPGEKDVIKKPPRNPKEGIMSRLMYERSILVGLIISAGVVCNFISALDEGVSLERARTIAVTTMVLFQFFQAWNSRSELKSVFRINPLINSFLFYSMVAAFLAQIAVIYVPALQWIFKTEALSLIIFDSVFYEMAALLLLAAAIAALAVSLRHPLIIGYILVGILVGPSGLGRIIARHRIDLLAKMPPSTCTQSRIVVRLRRVRPEGGISQERSLFSQSNCSLSPRQRRAPPTKSLIPPKRNVAICIFCSFSIEKPPFGIVAPFHLTSPLQANDRFR